MVIKTRSQKQEQECTWERRARRDTEGIVSGLAGASQERRKERMHRIGGSCTPDDGRLEIGPRHDLVASRSWCVELDSNA